MILYSLRISTVKVPVNVGHFLFSTLIITWQCSNWMLVVITAERLTAIFLPHKAKSLWTKKRCRIVIICIAVMISTISTTLGILSFREWHERPSNSNSLLPIESLCAMCIEHAWKLHFFSSVLPGLPIMCGNCLILWKLWQRKRAMKNKFNIRGIPKNGACMKKKESIFPSMSGSSQIKLVTLDTVNGQRTSSLNVDAHDLKGKTYQTLAHQKTDTIQSHSIIENESCMEFSDSNIPDSIHINQHLERQRSASYNNALQEGTNFNRIIKSGRPAQNKSTMGTSKNCTRKSSPLNMIMILIFVVFIGTNFPISIYAFYVKLVISPSRDITYEDGVIYFLFTCLLSLNSSINIFCYSISGSKFRNQLKNIFTSC